MPSDDFLRAFLAQRGLNRADGRPLYAYRCTIDEMRQARRLVRTDLQGTGPEYAWASTAQSFCLFAAEWWRRHHEGGPWKWEEILDECGIDGPLPSIYPMVEAGLTRWKRKLLYSRERRIFLVTLACEGGLPLRLVQREGAALQTFFRHLIEEVQQFQSAGVTPVILAENLSLYLRPSLRQTVVYELAGRLASAIWDLQDLVGDSPNPIEVLDSRHPGWRQELPLELEDDTARALLNRLVIEAADLKRRRPPRFRAIRRLRRVGPETWDLERELAIPEMAYGEQLAELFGLSVDDLPTRFQLALSAGDGPRQLVGIATEVRTERGRAFRIECPRLGALTERGVDATTSLELWVDLAGTTVGPIAFSGSAPLSDLPWTAVESQDGEVSIVGQGSVRVRDSECLVLVPPDVSKDALIGDAFAYAGQLEAPKRPIWRTTRPLTIALDEGPCVVRTLAEDATTLEYRLAGPSLEMAWPERIMLGRPRVVATPREGERRARTIPNVDIEWRPRNSRSTWYPYDDECLGAVAIRIKSSGELVFQTSTAVAPAELAVKLEPTREFGRGAIVFDGFRSALLKIELPDGLQAVSSAGRIELVSQTEPPARVSVSLTWSKERALQMHLPYPARGARFIDGDEVVLRVDQRVALSSLSAIRAVALTTDRRERFVLEGTLVDKGLYYGADLRVWREIPSSSTGPHELSLRFLEESLRQLFSETRKLDAFVRLRIDSNRGSTLRPRPILIARFSLEFRYDQETGQVEVVGTDIFDAADLRCEAVRLWDPGDDPVPLTKTDSGWLFSPVQAGPWLLVGWLGNECRVRPTVWNTSTDNNAGEGDLDRLQRAILVGDNEARKQVLREELLTLATDPLCDEWETLDRTLQLSARLPASSFDLTREVTRVPRTAVTALLRAATPNAFETVWDGLQELPFLWCLVSIEDWLAAATNYARALRELYARISDSADPAGPAFSTFLEHGPLVEHRAFLRPIAQLVSHYVLKPLGEESDLRAALTTAGVQRVRLSIEPERQLLLQRRSEDDQTWPLSNELVTWLERVDRFNSPRLGLAMGFASNVASHKRSVILAPAIAAWCVTHRETLPKQLLHPLRALRSFDEAWFDKTLPLFIYLFLDERLLQKESQLG